MTYLMIMLKKTSKKHYIISFVNIFWTFFVVSEKKGFLNQQRKAEAKNNF